MPGQFIPRSRPRPARRFARALVALLILARPGPAPLRAASAPPVRASSGMVVSEDSVASEVGRELLRRGGNAVDAAVGTALALAVTYPEAGNLGGGGFLLLRQADGRLAALDFRETAPHAARPALYLGPDGRPIPDRSLRGGLAVGIPGSVAGLYEAHRRWGRLPWHALVAPAERLAAAGFSLSEREASQIAERAADFLADPGARAVFLRAGAPLRPGDRLVQKDLARTLRRIAAHGPAGFYQGPVAEAIVRVVREGGGVLDASDLASYRPVAREPIVGSYRGLRVIVFPPPSSGGIALLQILQLLEGTDLGRLGPGSSRTVHRMVEAAKRAYADRAQWLGDPDFVSVPTARLLDHAYLAARAAEIEDDRATPSSAVTAGPAGPRESEQTTHLAAADADGSVVALTTTLNSSFGGVLLAPGTGVLLNNEIDDFALAPGIPNQFGLTGGAANALSPGRRPVSSMCPTIVERSDGPGRPWLVLGSPGGSTIITTVLQVIVNVVDHQMGLQEAIDAPRFHHQWLPDRIDHERNAFSRDVEAALARLGHQLAVRPPIGDVPAIGSAPDGAWLGAIDPRRGGAAAGYSAPGR